LLKKNDNKSVPIGTIAAVRNYMEKLGFAPLLHTMKRRGEPLFPLVCSLISYRLTENFSVEGCGRWLDSPEVRQEIGLRNEVSHRMLNRAIERMGEGMPEVLAHLRHSLLNMYDLPHTDVNIDTSSLSVYSRQGDLFQYGYSRDKRPDLQQVNFAAAELREPVNIPFHLSVDEGNTSDSAQFIKVVDEIVGDLNDDSMFVFDAGGDVKQVLDRITAKRMRYVTRKRMNKSDDDWISHFKKEDAVLVNGEDGVWCQKRTFASSGRTTYLFFSEKLHRDKTAALNARAWRCVEDAKETMRMKSDGTLRVSKTVVKRMRNPLIALNVAVQGRFFGSDHEGFEYVRNELSNRREGFFKLECSHDLTPSEVYGIYRRRDTVEKLIDSLKNHIEIKPLRVWSDNSVRGVLLICFLAQVIVSMIRYEHAELRKYSTKFIIRSLEKLFDGKTWPKPEIVKG